MGNKGNVTQQVGAPCVQQKSDASVSQRSSVIPGKLLITEMASVLFVN